MDADLVHEEWEATAEELPLTEAPETASAPPNPAVELNMDSSTWEGWANGYMLWIAQNPWQFLYYVLLCLTPFFFISMLLSWKLAKAIEAQEKDRKRSARRGANLAKTRRAKSD